jgi:hypothetical protein
LEETHKINTLNKYKTPYQQVEYLAKHKSNDLIKNTSIEKLLETTQLEKEENFNTVSIEVNPELIKHNLLDLGLGEQYMNSTVGTFLNHPAGGDYSNIR